MKSKLFIGCCVLALSLAGLACEVTSEKIQTWKRSVKGAAKLRACVRDTGQKLPIRVEAAVALAELGVYAHLAEDIKSLEAKDRKRLMDALIKSLIRKMEGTNPKASTQVQLQAKDALFSLRGVADEASRRTVDDKVVRWVLGDWRKRNTGEHSSEKIIKTVGQPAGAIIAEVIDRGGAPLVACATLLRKVGSQGARDLAAQKLVALAKKEKPPRVQTYHALGKVGSLKAVAHLEQVAREAAFETRTWALRALQLFPHVGVVETMKSIAGDTSLTDDKALLRDEAFTVLEKIDDPKSLDALASFLDSDEKDKDTAKTVRYRAAEAILAGFEEKGLTKLLENLPSRYSYDKRDLEDFIEKDIRRLGAKALPALRAALDSKSWVARLIAARVLGEIGTKADVAALEKLSGDRTRLKGWDGGATLGSEAGAALQKIKARK